MALTVDAARKALCDPKGIVFSERAEQALRGAGLPLADLLAVTITSDPAVRVLLEHVSGHCFQDWSSMVEVARYDCDATAMLDGHFLWHQLAWPAALERYDLFVEWCDRSGSRFAQIAPTERSGRLDHLSDHNPEAMRLLPELRSIAQAIRDRYGVVMGLLRSGVLEAQGHANGSGEPARILSGIWSASKTRINFTEGEILRLVDVSVERTGNWPPSRVERTEVLWSGVVVRRPVQMEQTNVPPLGKKDRAVTEQKNKGGRLQEYPWEDAFDRLTVKSWGNPRPETGAALVAQMVECLREAGFLEPNDEYVKQYLSDKHETLWQACVKKQSPSRKPRIRRR